ncbi:MAG: GNAT family protein [Chloroflexota bacterium]
MRLELGVGLCVRDWERDDAPALARHADDPAIARWLRDTFPSPYSLGDARRWISAAIKTDPRTSFAIALDGESIGAISVELGTDVYRLSAEVGYWVGQAHWGKGVATRALMTFTPWAFEAYGLERVWAGVFAANAASARVLEKAGYALEGRMWRALVKDGTLDDLLLYARVREG